MEGRGGCGRGPDPQACPHPLQDDRCSYHPVPTSGIPRKEFKHNSRFFQNFLLCSLRKRSSEESKITTGILLTLFAITFAFRKHGRLYNRMGRLYNRTSCLHNRTGRLNNKMSPLHNRTGRLYNRTGRPYNRTVRLYNMKGCLYNRTGRLYNRTSRPTISYFKGLVRLFRLAILTVM